MKYVFRKHPSKLATLMVTFGAGARVEHNTEYPAGIAHYMEHVRFKGTDKHTAKDLMRKTADAGGAWNAWTSEDLVSYHMNIPEENLETAFECLSDVVLNPIFPQEELTKEQEVVCQEVRMYNDDIDHLVHCKLMNTVFDNSLTSPIVGSEESVQAISREHILKFNQEFYSKEHMLIALSAGSDHSYLVDKYFGIPDDVLLFLPPAPTTNYGAGAHHLVHKKEQLQNSISIAFGNEQLREVVENNRAKVKMFSAIFGQGDTSRLFMKVREDLGLVYGIGSYCMNNMDGKLYEIYTSTEPENSDQVIEAIEGEIEKVKSEPPTEQELSRAKNMIRSSYYRMMDTSSTAIMQVLYREFFGHTIDSEFLAEINEVTTEDVHEMAQEIFAGNKYTVIGTGT